MNTIFEYPSISYLYHIKNPFTANSFQKEHIIQALLDKSYRVSNSIRMSRKKQRELLRKESIENLFNMASKFIEDRQKEGSLMNIYEFISWSAILNAPSEFKFVVSGNTQISG